MTAPDDHWLLVKAHWVDIEKQIKNRGGVGADAKERIDSLSEVLSESTIETLHQLRRERNELVHHNKPFPDPELWKQRAEEVEVALRPPPPPPLQPTPSTGGLPSELNPLAVIGLLLVGIWILASPTASPPVENLPYTENSAQTVNIRNGHPNLSVRFSVAGTSCGAITVYLLPNESRNVSCDNSFQFNAQVTTSSGDGRQETRKRILSSSAVYELNVGSDGVWDFER